MTCDRSPYPHKYAKWLGFPSHFAFPVRGQSKQTALLAWGIERQSMLRVLRSNSEACPAALSKLVSLVAVRTTPIRTKYKNTSFEAGVFVFW